MNRLVFLTVAFIINLVTLPAYSEQINGHIEFSKKTTLSSVVSGMIDEIPVAIGSRVKKDTLLLRMDQRPFKTNVDSTQADVKKKKQIMVEAKREWGRSKELYERTNISDHELELTRIAYVTAEAEYQEALAKYEHAKLNQEYSQLLAPFDAIILDIHVNTGESVISRLQATPLITLAESNAYIAVAYVQPQLVAGLKPGSDVTVSIENQKITGKLVAVYPQLDAQKKGHRTETRFVMPDNSNVQMGQTVTLQLK